MDLHQRNLHMAFNNVQSGSPSLLYLLGFWCSRILSSVSVRWKGLNLYFGCSFLELEITHCSWTLSAYPACTLLHGLPGWLFDLILLDWVWIIILWNKGMQMSNCRRWWHCYTKLLTRNSFGRKHCSVFSPHPKLKSWNDYLVFWLWFDQG